MCDCLPWYHPLWTHVARRAGVKPLQVWGIVSTLREGDQFFGRLGPKDRVAVLAQGTGEKPMTIALIIASLQQVGVVDAGGRLAPADENADEKVTKFAAHFVTGRRRGRPPIGPQAMTGAERTARWKAKTAATNVPSSADENAGGISSPASRFLFSEDHQQEEQKQSRARADENGFAELCAIWPVANRTADAEREYKRAQKHASPAELLTLARHYIDNKPAWQSWLFLVNWLRTEPWRDPMLPLTSSPREVTSEAATMPASCRPDWVGRLKRLKETGVWPPDWGPRWGEPGCLVPSEAIGVSQGFARWFAAHQPIERQEAV